MNLLDKLWLLQLVFGIGGEELNNFHRDEQAEEGKTCPLSERVINETSENVMECASLCYMSSECASLYYLPADHVCYGCKQDLHSSDLSLVDTDSQTIYFVKGSSVSVTCMDIQAESPDMTSGRYFNIYGMEIFCDLETDGGGWTVFQMRFDNTTDFDRNWTDYKHGFGNINGGEFWLGLEKLERILRSTNKQFELRVDLADSEGNTTYAVYKFFYLSGESENYRLYGGNYSGTAGDSLFDRDGKNLYGQMFSTKDFDNDEFSLANWAEIWPGGWWFSHVAADAMLNGPFNDRFGVYWKSVTVKPFRYTYTSMKVREL